MQQTSFPGNRRNSPDGTTDHRRFLLNTAPWSELAPLYVTRNSTEILVCPIIACSQHRHGQDKTVLSRPCQRCEHNCRHLSCLDPVSNFQVFSNLQYIWDWTVAIWKLGRDKTKLSCLVANCVYTADMDKTRQDSFVLSVSAMWTSY